MIAPEAASEFKQTLRETGVEAVVAFNKGIFNLVSQVRMERYVERLMAGDLIQSQISGFDRDIPIYLTLPTGWRYRRGYMQFRKASLDRIRTAICSGSKVREPK